MVTEEEPHHRPLIGDYLYGDHDYNHCDLDDQDDHGLVVLAADEYCFRIPGQWGTTQRLYR